MADRNEADALFATKRKKQQEKQAEQERREEMSRKKAEDVINVLSSVFWKPLNLQKQTV